MRKYRRIITALTFVLIFGLNLVGFATSELSDSEIIAKASNNTYSVKSFYNNIIVEDKKITSPDNFRGGVYKIAVGNILNDGKLVRGAVVLMQYNSGGSGRFHIVAACIPDDEGEYIGTNAASLGDRILPEDIRFENGKIIVRYLIRRKEEPMSATPTVFQTKTFTIIGGELSEY